MVKRSNGELLLAEQLRQAHIPFEEEFAFHPTRKWRADFYLNGRLDEEWSYPPLLIEVEGGIGQAGRSRHSSYDGFKKDCEKYAEAAILGYRVIRSTTEQVEDGTCLSWIRRALGLES